MSGCHHLTRIIGKQQWQTIGHHDGAGYVCVLSDARISDRGAGRGGVEHVCSS
jgi:hypothetical protein